MEYCIVGLGNPGKQYYDTRHNIGFRVIESIAEGEQISFSKDRVAYYSKMNYYQHTIYLLKPLLYMNHSGKAVAYWLKKLKIPLAQLLVVVDDLHLPLGQIRLRTTGGAGGHNGLKDITNSLGSNEYPRLRLGIGKNYADGQQSDYVLGNFKPSEKKEVANMIQVATEAILSFCKDGIATTMSTYNH